MTTPPDLPYRVGLGFDLHRLDRVEPAGGGRPFVLGGVLFDHAFGPVGHSDGDTLYHALTDAILGAIGGGDIGQLFPDTSPQYEGAASEVFVEVAAHRMREAGYEIGNVDLIVICERPKLGSHRKAIVTNVARVLRCTEQQVNLKGKTHEQVDAVGEGRALEVHAIVLVQRVRR